MRRAEATLLAACAALVLTACGSTHDTSNPDWGQAGMPPPPKRTEQDREWTETEAPPPPAFVEARSLPIEMPPYMNLKFAVDPATITITGDGLVRYVAVGTSKSGNAVNAFYEGVRCATEEMKGYARSSGGGWETVADPQWRSFRAMNSSYTKAIAQQALCQGGAPRSSVSEMIGRLKKPVRESE